MAGFRQQENAPLFPAFFMCVLIMMIGYTSSTESKPQVDPSPKLAIFGGNLTLLCTYTPAPGESIAKIEWRRAAAKLVFFEQSWDHPGGEPVTTWFGAFRTGNNPGVSENAAFHGSTDGRIASITIFNVGYTIEGDYTCAFRLDTSDGWKTVEANVAVKLGVPERLGYPEMGKAVSASRSTTRADNAELYTILSAAFAFISATGDFSRRDDGWH